MMFLKLMYGYSGEQACDGKCFSV